jgi:hypothetical protein
VDLTADHFTDGIDGIVVIIYLCLKICDPISTLLAHCSPYAPKVLHALSPLKTPFNAAYGVYCLF